MRPFQLSVWGHRGSQTDSQVARDYQRPFQFAENSLPALQWALEQGATGIEIDVMPLRYDDQNAGHAPADCLAVTHSNDLSQHVFAADGQPEKRHGYVGDQTLEQIRALRVGPNRDGRIPTLGEVMRLVAQEQQRLNRPLTLNIEIKDTKDSDDPRQRAIETVDLVASAIKNGPLSPQQVVVSSFALRDLEHLASHHVGCKLGMLFYGDGSAVHPLYPALPESAAHTAFTPETIRKAAQSIAAQGENLSAVHPEIHDIDPSTMRQAAHLGLAVNPWFMNERAPQENEALVREKIAMARAAGVREMHLITNFPSQLHAMNLHGFATRLQEADASGPAL